MKRYKTVVIGAGPAGTGPLVYAIQKSREKELLDQGVAWIDQGDGMVSGNLGGYEILSDTASSVLLECLRNQESGPLAALIDHPMAHEIRGYGSGPLPLPVAGRYLAALGEVVRVLVDASKTSDFYPRAKATNVVVERDGSFVVHTEGAPELQADKILFALGGRQIPDVIYDATIAGDLRLRDGYLDKTILTSVLVTAAGQADIKKRLADKPDPRIVIVGGSHSAITAAWLMLNRSGLTFSEGAIRVLCRRKPKIFYPTGEAAKADGYKEWNERDVCPVTGRVFRLSGLRLSARDLVRSIWGLGDLPREKRVDISLFTPGSDVATLVREFERADVIIPAFGYAPRTVPVSKDGKPIQLMSETRYRAPLVDGSCRVIMANGEPLPSVFAMGLASGFVPHGALGGEPSFDGQTNGLWLYQNDLGAMVLDHLLA